MIALAQATELAKLINDYTDMAIRMREWNCTIEEFNASKKAMSNYLASLVVKGA